MAAPAAVTGLEPPFWRLPRWWHRTGIASLGVWIAAGLGVAGSAIAARSLGATDWGAVVLAVATASLVARLLDLTLEEAVVHHGHRLVEAGDFAGVRGLLRTALLVDLGVGTVVVAALVAGAEPLASVLGGDLDPSLLRLAALVAFAQTIDGTTTATLLVAGRAELRGVVMAASSLFRLVLVAGAIWVGGPEAVLVAFVLAAGLAAAVQSLLAWNAGRRWRIVSRARTSGVPARELLRFGMHSSFTTSVVATRGSLFSVLLGGLAGSTAVGVFDVALLPVSVADTASAPLRLSVFPEHARLAARGETRKLRHAVALQTLIGLVVAVPGVAVGWILLPKLIPLVYSSEFSAAVWPARILLVAAAANLAVSWSKTLAAAVGRPNVRTALALADVVLLVGLMLLFGSRGAVGAAIALTSSSVLFALAWCVAARWMLSTPHDLAEPEKSE